MLCVITSLFYLADYQLSISNSYADSNVLTPDSFSNLDNTIYKPTNENPEKSTTSNSADALPGIQIGSNSNNVIESQDNSNPNIQLVASSNTVYIGGTNSSDTTITIKASDNSLFGYISIDGYYSNLNIRADSMYGPEDIPRKVHDIVITQINPNSSGKQTINISAYGDNGLYKGSFDVIYSKSSYYIAENATETRTDGTDTITYTYGVNITEASLQNNSIVIVSIPTSSACNNTSSLIKKYTYNGPSSYNVDCIVTRYIPPPPCTQIPCYVPPMRSAGTLRISVSVLDSNGQYIHNLGYSNFDFIVPDDYDM